MAKSPLARLLPTTLIKTYQLSYIPSYSPSNRPGLLAHHQISFSISTSSVTLSEAMQLLLSLSCTYSLEETSKTPPPVCSSYYYYFCLLISHLLHWQTAQPLSIHG